MGLTLAVIPFGALWTSLSAAIRPGQIGAELSVLQIVALAFAMLAIIALNAAFIAGEVAIDLLRASHLKNEDEDSPNSARLIKFLERKELFVAACVLGAQTMRSWLILLCFLPAPTLAESLGWINADTPVSQMFLYIFGTAVLLTLPVMFINVIAAELVAKSYAVSRPHKAALRLGGILSFFEFIFRIPAIITIRVADLITQRFGTDASFTTDTTKAEEDIKEILETTQESGELEEGEREMLSSVFEFGDTVAREVMTPRVDVESIPKDADLMSVASLVEATGHSRFPVYEETDDQIVGIVHAKDILRALARGQKDDSLAKLIRPPMFVTENKNLHDLLAEMKTVKTQMAIIQDEFGGTAGIVTIEDIVEEIVGEIVDEYDTDIIEVVSEDTHHVVNGKVHLDDLNEVIGSGFESEEFDTIGGYVFGLFGRQPESGEKIDDGEYMFSVVESDGRRILSVKVEELPPQNPTLAHSD